jgi:hypothetical protein
MIPLSTLSIFDLTTQTWSQILASGATPAPRVNPCVVLAPDNKTIYMYGGQNVFDPVPRPQMNDIWILTLPDFKWVQVPPTNLVGSGVPPGRSQHSCHVIGGEMVVLGGDTGNLGGCDGAGVYVFDMNSLQWKDRFDGGTNFVGPPVLAGDKASSTACACTPAESTTLQATRTATGADPTWITTNMAVETVPTTLLDGQTSLITVTFKTTATVTSAATATSIPPASSTSTQKQTTPTPTTAIVGATLGAIILLLILAWILTAFIKRRKENAWRNSTSSFANGFLAPQQQGVYQESDTGAEGGTDEMREWDVSEWDGGLLRSPRQSLRVVNV